MNRPSPALLESAYSGLFQSTLDKLKESAVHGRLFPGRHDEEGVPGRSIAWKLFLTRQPPLTTGLNLHPEPPLDSLRHSRERYVSLLKDKMRAPDGSYEEGFHVPGDSAPTSAAPQKPDNWNLNNPLSLDSSNPWHAYFSALDSRNTIRQDVERTFPELSYFRSVAVQNEMTHILFLHVSERENVGYRQGMHELLACVYRAVDFDSVERGLGQLSPELEELCDRTYVAADAYSLFAVIMQHMETWYEWRPPIQDPVSPASPLSSVPHFSSNGEILPFLIPQPQVDVLANGQLDLRPYVAPIVPTCASLRDDKLRVVDPRLWEMLRDGGVEPQMYGIRWLRLLFTREFSLAESMVIWDALFASLSADLIFPSPLSTSRPSFELALWICVAMLIRIRNKLIPGDYTVQLTYLLHYPPPSLLGASSQTSHLPELLLSQTQLLIASPTPGTGASLVMQNRNELGIPVEVPDPPLPPSRRRHSSGISVTAPPTVSASHGRISHVPDRPRLQDMIANRLMDANESLGIQRGIFNTITELRKNLPDLSQTLVRTPPWNGSAISLVDGRPDMLRSPRSPSLTTPDVDKHPPWEPRPRSEVEREIKDLRALLKTLGNAVGWAVDVLLLDEEAQETNEGRTTLRLKKKEAVECMAYVREVLASGGTGEVDEERLVSEEEYKKGRQRKEEKERAAAAPESNQPQPVSPLPRIASPEVTLDATAKTMLSTRNSMRPIPSLTRTAFTHAETPLTPTRNALNTSFTSRVGHVPRSKPRPLSTSAEAQKIVPPWQHTRSNFSEHSSFASGSLPRLPPPSTTAPPRRPSDHSLSRPQDMDNVKHESPRTDPLGVLR